MLAEDLDHGLATGDEREPKVTLERRRQVGDELIREQRLVEPPLLSLGSEEFGGDARVATEDPLRGSGHHPEQDEVDDDDQEDRDRRGRQIAAR